jgi:glucokinase
VDGAGAAAGGVGAGAAAGAAGGEDLALGLDIGGTKVAAVLMGRSAGPAGPAGPAGAAAAVLSRARGAVDATDNAAGLASIFRVVDACLEGAAGAPGAGGDGRGVRGVRDRLRGIGAGCPGSIDWRAGVVRGATNLGWRHLPLAEALRARYGVPALVDNDVNVAAWGERCFGAGAPADDLVFITVGTGIGAGLVAAGRILRGRGGTAGEIGHIPLFEDGPRCACGLTGCLEALASGPAFARAGRAAAAAGEAPGLLALAGGDAAAIDPPLILRAAAAGDAAAGRLLDREGHYLALAVLIAGRLLDPARVVLGGGLTEAGAALFGALWDNLARLRPRGPRPADYAVPAALGPDAGAAGAAALVLVPEPGFAGAGISL